MPYPRWQTPFVAFFSPRCYREQVRRAGTGMLYLWCLVALVWAAQSLQIGIRTSIELAPGGELRQLLDQIPAIHIRNGVVSTDVEEPYFITDSDDDGNQIVIDTTGTITELESERGLLLMRDQLILRKNAFETRTIDLSHIKSFDLERGTVLSWAGFLPLALGFGVFAVMLVVAGIYRTLLALVLGGIALAIARVSEVPMNFSAAVRCTTVAQTPAIILAALLSLVDFGPSGCFSWFLWGACNLGYTVFAVMANRETRAA